MSDLKKYDKYIKQAVNQFWNTRSQQIIDQKAKNRIDQGNRSAVTGGKQLDGFIDLMTKVSKDIGIPERCIFTKSNYLPGYFRPTKAWDFLIVSPSKKLISVIEFKSQVGSFSNNFNNRTEEALGSAVDIWTAYRENVFPKQQAPWIGYLMIIEKSDKSVKNIRIRSPHFEVLKEFNETSYLDRYAIFCRKLMLERHYSATSLMWTRPNKEFGFSDAELSMESFLSSFIGHLQGKLNEFK